VFSPDARLFPCRIADVTRSPARDVSAFPSQDDWIGHLRALGVTELRVAPDPVRVASEITR